MPTYVNNPPPAPAPNDGSGTSALVTLLVVIILAIIFFVYALPALRGRDEGAQINIPDKIEVDTGGNTGQ